MKPSKTDIIEYEQEDAIAIPVNIQPKQITGVWRDLLPGVRLTLYAGPTRGILEQMDAKLPPNASILTARSHILFIRPTVYLAGVRQRIQSESGILPKDAVELVEPESLARQCLVACILTSKSRCAYASYYILNKQSGKWLPAGFSNKAQEATSLHTYAALKSKPLDLRKTKHLVSKLDRYYRAISWWTDRIGMALAYFWEGLCAQHSAQTYISLFAAIDALVGTKKSCGHVLGERVAVFLGTDSRSRRTVYEKFVALYRVRNQIVHGSAFPRKGKQTLQGLWIGAKRSNIPYDKMSELITICVQLITRCLEDPEYLSIVRNNGPENKTEKQLDALFLYRLLDA